MESTADPSNLMIELSAWLEIIDARLSGMDMPVWQRIFSAATEFVRIAVTGIDTSSGPEPVPESISEIATQNWFRAIYRSTEIWYQKRYGIRATKVPERSFKAIVSIFGTAYLLNIPTTVTFSKEDGAIWIGWPAAIQDREDPISWLEDAPDLDQDPAEARRVLKTTIEIATNIRAIHSRWTGIAHDDKQVVELIGGVPAHLKHAAELMIDADARHLKQAHWELQMAAECALKGLSQQRSGSFHQTHDLFELYDRTPGAPPAFKRDELKKLPRWQDMIDLRYGQGPARNFTKTFAAYRATLKIVLGAFLGLSGLDLTHARFKIAAPPWMKPIEPPPEDPACDER